MQLLTLAVLAFVGFSNVQSQSATLVLQRFIVECGSDSAKEVVKKYCRQSPFKAQRNEVRILKDDYDICLCHLTHDQADSLRNTGETEFVVLDEPMSKPGGESSSRPKDGYDAMTAAEEIPYGISMIKASYLWDKTVEAEMIICVVDTGYAVEHPDLSSTNVAGYDYEDMHWDIDVDGHGTHVAGTIGAIGDNNIGVTGVIKDPTSFRLFAARGLDDAGSGTNTQVMAAVAECDRNGAKVINMSLGGSVDNPVTKRFYKDIYDKGILIVAASGNVAVNEDFFPASFPFVISVVAVDNEENLYHNTVNSQVEIAAPGVSILSSHTSDSGSTYNYAELSGTSMATSHVSGGALALWSIFPNCTNNQIRNVLLHSAKQQPNSVCNENYGHGILNLEDAYDLLSQNGCEAGGDVSPSPSFRSYGGCAQLNNYYYNPCTDDMLYVTVIINSGKHAAPDKDNTRWEIIDQRNGDKGMSGGNFTQFQEVVISGCLPMAYHTFFIYDDNGDGLGRRFHINSGSYEVKLNNLTIAEGDNFGFKMNFTFPDSVTSTLSPTQSLSPTVSQAPTNICGDCGIFNFFSCYFFQSKTKDQANEYCKELTQKKDDKQYCKRQLNAKYINCFRKHPNRFS